MSSQSFATPAKEQRHDQMVQAAVSRCALVCMMCHSPVGRTYVCWAIDQSAQAISATEDALTPATFMVNALVDPINM